MNVRLEIYNDDLLLQLLRIITQSLLVVTLFSTSRNSVAPTTKQKSWLMATSLILLLESTINRAEFLDMARGLLPAKSS